MFKNLIAATAALALTASPALARTNDAFVGPRVEANVGFADVGNDEVDYGLSAGFDAPVADRITLGVDVDAQNVFEGHRTLGVGARVGAAVSPRTLVFGRVGYSRADLNDNSLDLEGLAAGGGAQFAVTNNAYVSTEYRYTDFNQGRGNHGVRVGLGLRF